MLYIYIYICYIIGYIYIYIVGLFPRYAKRHVFNGHQPHLLAQVPCNDSPCNFQRLFTGAGIPGTAPDVLGVQNGIARPVVTGRSGEVQYSPPVR